MLRLRKNNRFYSIKKNGALSLLRRKNALQAKIRSYESKGKMNKEALKNYQILEQSLQAVHMQKQQFQAQLIEIESALVELSKSSTAYKIVGNIMVSSKKEDLKKDLEEKKEVFSARLKILEKQEQKYQEEAGKLHKELMKGMKE